MRFWWHTGHGLPPLLNKLAAWMVVASAGAAAWENAHSRPAHMQHFGIRPHVQVDALGASLMRRERKTASAVSYPAQPHEQFHVPKRPRGQDVACKWHFLAQNFQRSLLVLMAVPGVIVPLARFWSISGRCVWAVALFLMVSASSLLFVGAAAVAISPRTSALLLLQFVAALFLGPEYQSASCTCGLEMWPVVARETWKNKPSPSGLDVVLPILRMLMQMEVLKRLPLQIAACVLSVAPLFSLAANQTGSQRSMYCWLLRPSSASTISILCLLGSTAFMVVYVVQQLPLETTASRTQSLPLVGFWILLLIADACAPRTSRVTQKSACLLQVAYPQAKELALCTLGLLAWAEGSLELAVLHSLSYLELLLILLACMIGPILQHTSRLLHEAGLLMWKDSLRIASMGPALVADAVLWDVQVSEWSAILLLGCLLCGAVGTAPVFLISASSAGRDDGVAKEVARA